MQVLLGALAHHQWKNVKIFASDLQSLRAVVFREFVDIGELLQQFFLYVLSHFFRQILEKVVLHDLRKLAIILKYNNCFSKIVEYQFSVLWNGLVNMLLDILCHLLLYFFVFSFNLFMVFQNTFCTKSRLKLFYFVDFTVGTMFYFLRFTARIIWIL